MNTAHDDPALRDTSVRSSAAAPSPPASPIFTPTPEAAARSQLSAFAATLSVRAVQDLRDPVDLQRYAVAHHREFWRHLLDEAELLWSGDASEVCTTDVCETARFFPGLYLNYAENILHGHGAPADAPAVISCPTGGPRASLTRGELRERVECLAEALREQGLGVGDHAVAVMRNDEHAVIAALAVAAVGASLATASPEMGPEAVIDRFGPLQPRLMLAHAEARPHDTGMPVAVRVAKVAAALPTLSLMVTLDDARLVPPQQGLQVRMLSSLLARHRPDEFHWQHYPFNHPLFVLASSGTTGRPKCIVHGAGGSLLEHVKEHRLHLDLSRADRLFFQTSCAWMMWHWQLSALGSGCAIVLRDGPVADARALWRVVQDERVTVFGTSPPYLKLGEDAGLAPGLEFDLSPLRAILSTGSILYDHAYHWVSQQVKNVPLQSISGGTDILGCFVLGHPQLPVRVGEAQCRSLGLDVRAAPLSDDTSGTNGKISTIGELICANPFPSRPLGFHGDTDGSRFHDSYFARHPGVWTHGDLIEFGPEGGARLHGRTDGVMNIRGIRVGPADVYRVVRGFEQVRDAMVVEQHAPAAFSEGRAVLLLVLHDGITLDGGLAAALRRRLAEAASPAHVPDVILQVAELPYTHSGKASEAAMTDAVNGRPVRNLAALRNPACLDAVRHAAVLQAPGQPGHAAEGPRSAPPAAPGWRSRADTESYLQALWERLFGFSPIRPDDDFFELGGHSLMAARMLADIRRATHRDLALTTLLQAPTIRQLAATIDALAWSAPAPLVQLRPGQGRPFFLVHSMSGTFLELWAVLRVLDTRRPVYGLQARGLEAGQQPHLSVGEMAVDYIERMRSVQPHGPYDVGGYSFGGLVAFDIAQRLLRAGEQVELLSLIDTHVHGRYLPLPQWLQHRVKRVLGTLRTLRSLDREARLTYMQNKAQVLVDRIRAGLGLRPLRPDLVGDLLREASFPPELRRVRGAMLMAMRDYRPEPYPGKAVFVRASDPGEIGDALPFWRKVVRGGLDVSDTPGNHDEMISGANARALADQLAHQLEEPRLST